MADKILKKKIYLFVKILFSSLDLLSFLLAVLFSPLIWLLTLLKRLVGSKPAIFYGLLAHPTLIDMAKADRLYGYRARSASMDKDHIVDGFSFDIDFSNLIRKLQPFPVRFFIPPFFFLYTIMSFDIFVYYFRSLIFEDSPFRWLELPVLKLLGKKILVLSFGSDVQQVSILVQKGYKYHVFSDLSKKRIEEIRAREPYVRRNIAYFNRFADVMYGCWDNVDYTPRSDVSFRKPIDEYLWKPYYPPADKTRPLIIHPTNHPEFKGTKYLLAALRELEKEGLNLDFRLVLRIPRKDAIEIYREADIVVTGLIMGCYAQIEVECMALGKPIICYLRKDYFEYHPHWNECPIVNANPETIVGKLRDLVRDGSRRHELGKKGREFIEKYHSLRSVGKENDEIYTALWNGGPLGIKRELSGSNSLL